MTTENTPYPTVLYRIRNTCLPTFCPRPWEDVARDMRFAAPGAVVALDDLNDFVARRSFDGETVSVDVRTHGNGSTRLGSSEDRDAFVCGIWATMCLLPSA